MTCINPLSFQEYMIGLTDLLIDAVNGGASLGFHMPMGLRAAEKYWKQVAREVSDCTREIIIALDDDGKVIGSVQMALPWKPNAKHRCELQKLMVHSKHRCAGVGTALMQELERVASESGKTLVVLDTRKGDAASRLYEQLGYICYGEVPGFTIDSEGNPRTSRFYYKPLAVTDE